MCVGMLVMASMGIRELCFKRAVRKGDAEGRVDGFLGSLLI
jgi:hypothetical protein